MIDYIKHTLPNRMTVIAHRQRSTRMAAVNLLYKVGARDENPHRTGFAHLFEHLMFRGTKLVPDFDLPVQLASGENNAFTNNDYTNYYITLPEVNLETALWLESDRMEGLDIPHRKLETEKKVVIEEYNQRYANQPYGDMWINLRALAYKTHPYRWATIGLTPEHVAGASLADVKEFYKRFYHPGNAILSVASPLDPEQVVRMAEKWFGEVPDRGRVHRDLPAEPAQAGARRQEILRPLPADMVTVAFRMGERKSRSFYLCDLMTDILAGGSSARLYQSLVKERQLFSSINAVVTGEVDPGLIVVTGHLHPGVAVETGEKAVWEELALLQDKPVGDRELEKVKNKFEANAIFGEVNVMNRAMNLGYYEMLGDLDLINREVDIFRSVTAQELRDEARRLFREQNSSTLIYLGNEKA